MFVDQLATVCFRHMHPQPGFPGTGRGGLGHDFVCTRWVFQRGQCSSFSSSCRVGRSALLIMRDGISALANNRARLLLQLPAQCAMARSKNHPKLQ